MSSTAASVVSAAQPATPRPTVVGAQTLSPRQFQRAPHVAALAAEYRQDTLRGVAGQATIVPASRGILSAIEEFSYGTHKPKEARVLKAPADGTLDLTVVMSASGHTGQAQLYAQSNTYTVEVRFPNGSVSRMSGVRNTPKGQAEYVTLQDLSFPLIRGVTRVSAWPDGSAGAGGYIEGRTIHITY